MDQTEKTCSTCRKMVDLRAVLCPYCNSDVDYNHLIEISPNEITKTSHPVIGTIAIIAVLAVSGISFFFGLAFGGFLVGAGFAIFFFWVGVHFVPFGKDRVKCQCPECGTKNEYGWPGGTFENSKKGYFVCKSCRKKTTLLVYH